MKPEIFIRTDGSVDIGMGHLVRCTALAHMLKDDFNITFVCKLIPDEIKASLAENKFNLHLINEENDFLSLIESGNIVVLDGYHFTSDFQKEIKKRDIRLVCIDDGHDKELYTDLIINQIPGLEPKNFKAQPYTQFALGLDYALLRPSFIDQARNDRKIEKIETIMICFGGSDYKNFTESTLKIVSEYSEFKKIIVITGPVYQHLDALNRFLGSSNRILHYHSVDQYKMVKLMTEAELAIVPSSSILIEAIACGMITITGFNVDNQVEFHNVIKNEENIYSLGDMEEDFKKKLNMLLNSVILGKVSNRNDLRLKISNANINILNSFRRLLS